MILPCGTKNKDTSSAWGSVRHGSLQCNQSRNATGHTYINTCIHTYIHTVCSPQQPLSAPRAVMAVSSHYTYIIHSYRWSLSCLQMSRVIWIMPSWSVTDKVSCWTLIFDSSSPPFGNLTFDLMTQPCMSQNHKPLSASYIQGLHHVGWQMH